MDGQTGEAEFKVRSRMHIVTQPGKDVNTGFTLHMLISPLLPPVSSLSHLLYLSHLVSPSFIRGVGQIIGVMDGQSFLQNACSCRHAHTDIDIGCVCV